MQYWRISIFAVMLASAGLPLYIHLPQFASVELGIDLATVGAIVLGIRIFDFVQDPIIGRLIDRFSNSLKVVAAIAMVLMALGFAMLFVIPPLLPKTLWLVCALILVFTGYSVGSILMYGQSANWARQANDRSHLRLATFRETGLIVGVILAAIAPTALNNRFDLFGLLLIALIAAAGFASRSLWQKPPPPQESVPLKTLFRIGGSWLLALALLNALPVAMTSTLFLFFVEGRLGLPDLAGLFLILFFASSGLAMPLWSRLARTLGVRVTLVGAMVLAIAGFVGAASLPMGEVLWFAVICVVTGAAVGAELVILPTLFSSLLERNNIPSGQSFGIWSLATKISLPVAAAIALLLLDRVGYIPSAQNSVEALAWLNGLYAILPCFLKLAAIALVLSLPRNLTVTGT